MSVLLIFKIKQVLKPEFFKQILESRMHCLFTWVFFIQSHRLSAWDSSLSPCSCLVKHHLVPQPRITSYITKKKKINTNQRHQKTTKNTHVAQKATQNNYSQNQKNPALLISAIPENSEKSLNLTLTVSLRLRTETEDTA